VTRASAGVLDASVAVQCLLDGGNSASARSAVQDRADWIAPDLLHLEVASVALKLVRRGLIDAQQGAAMTARANLLLVETVPAAGLASEAFRLGVAHAFSAYDAAYLALAAARGISVLTADRKLAARAQDAGLGHLVEALPDA
jgi:predicted nucleic acid-binding protein